MKKLAIYFSDPEPMGYPFNSSVYPYWEVYQELVKNIERHNIGVYIVRGNSYVGKGVFSKGWQIRDGAMVEIDEPILVDLIFNRDDKNTIPAIYDCTVINHPDLDQICVDKVATAEIFSDFSPKTAAINSYKEYEQIASKWKLKQADKIVVKKNFLSGGRGIYIRPVSEISESLYDDWNDVLLQEFIDNSVGIPGIVDGLHDIRVITINGNPVFMLVRVPKPGSFLANVSQGGSEVQVRLEQIPPTLLAMVQQINTRLAQYRPSIFASDFVNSDQGFKLVELNSRPAVCVPSLSDDARRYMEAMAEMLVSVLS
jgi:glutathione synthase/RimK-type ligase-like ATP-grasp enzyme